MKRSPEYAVLEEALTQARVGLSPAELHGALSALLSADPDLDPDHWLTTALGDSLPLHALPDDARQQLLFLFDWTLRELGEAEFSFQLLLPEETAPLAERVQALASWAAGFNAALGSAFSSLEALPGEVSEYVVDLTEISRAEAPEEASESDETQFQELAEYTRLGAMMTFETLQPGGPPGAADTLH
ncbi:MAG: UPF0149 family protein [Pseudomonadota bacterium]